MEGLTHQRTAYAQTLQGAVDTILSRLSSLPSVKRISVVGSYGRGGRDLFTDLDILVIMETEEGFVERLRTLYGMLTVLVDLDLLCYTPAEWESVTDRPFFKRLREEEVVLYETKSA